MNTTLTAIQGLFVGHAVNDRGVTGCSVVLCPKGGVGGVSQYGGAPGTRETDLLKPMHLVNQVHGVVLTGGSAFGLSAATGVMEYLEKKRIGFNTGIARVPIVPGAVIYDLGIGDSTVRPDAAMGYAACISASSAPVTEGNAGAGLGACVGGMFGPKFQMKGGLGSVSIHLGGGLVVGALMVVNCFGDVVDEQGTIIAGARKPPFGKSFADTLASMKSLTGKMILKFAGRNTVIGVVATNAKLTKEEVNKVAAMAQDGIARAVRPAHTMFDGDTIFSLATGEKRADVNLVGAYAAETVAQSIRRAIQHARSIEHTVAASEYS